jgi:amino acid adenylation domain-containing protein
MRNFPSGGKVFRDFLGEVREHTLRAYENQEYPFDNLVELLNLRRDTSRNPIFDVMFNLLNQGDFEGEVSGVSEESDYIHRRSRTKFDISLIAIDRGEQLFFKLEYRTSLFKRVTAERMVYTFNTILKTAINEPHLSIKQIQNALWQKEEKLLREFNDTNADYPQKKGIQHLIWEQVGKAGDHIALESENQWISYLELDSLSDRCARNLVESGVHLEELVCLYMNRTIGMIIGMTGIIKSGAAYVPIEPTYKARRIEMIIHDSQGKIILTENLLYGNLPERIDRKIVKLDEFIRKRQGENAHPLLRSDITPKNAIYVIYTSGSTGKPKGVIVTHGNLMNYCWAIISRFEINTPLKYALVSTVSTDLGNTMIFPPLITGGSIHVLPSEVVLDIDQLSRYFQKNPVGVLKIVPSHLTAMLNEGVDAFVPHKILILGGEALSVQLLNEINQKSPGCRVYNHYGPTETTIGVTTWDCTYLEKGSKVIPIGTPLNNVRIYILDRAKRILPIGICGEIYVGGLNVARGYLNNSELTKEKFENISKPVAQITREQTAHIKDQAGQEQAAQFPTKVYRTGDLARWLSNGDIEFLGRADNQVKIRGYRIELGEIEAQIKETGGVKDTVVKSFEEKAGEKYLCAYIVRNKSHSLPGELKESKGMDIPQLRKQLSGQLPDYMIPTCFVELENIPITPNGKINRKALPKPEAGLTIYSGPGNKTEEKLQKLWSEVLKLEKEKIGIDSDFFELGGQSLKAIVLVSKIHREMQIKIPLIDFFRYSKIRALSKILGEFKKEEYDEINPESKKEYYPLSSAQKRLYILQQMDPKSTAYNMPHTFTLEGKPDSGKLKKAFLDLIKRHESLRTFFRMVAGIPRQRVSEIEELDIKIKRYKANKSEEINIFKGFVKPFDLTIAPLLRVGIMEITGGAPQLLLDMHHIISDGISQRILQEDFLQLIEGKEFSNTIKLQYRDYSEWQQSKNYRETIKEQEAFWKDEFSEKPMALDLPWDFPRPMVQNFLGSSISFYLGLKDAAQLKETGKQQGATLFMVLLSAFYLLLNKLSGNEDIVIGTPIAGRDHPDLEQIVGIFINTLAMRNYPKGEKIYTKFLKEVKRKSISGFENQRYPFEDLVEKIEVDRDISRNPIFDVMFILHNQLEGMEDFMGIDDDVIVHGRADISKFDITLKVIETGERIFFNLEYCRKLFHSQTIEIFINYLKRIIRQINQNPQTLISEIDLLAGDEKLEILYDFNQTELSLPEDKLIHQLFREEAERRSGNIILVFEDQEVSYRELNLRSFEIGQQLKERGVKKETIVVLLMERSLDIATGLLAILQSGGAYLPLDSEYPKARILNILEESGAKIILTNTIFELPDAYTNLNIRCIQLPDKSFPEWKYVNQSDSHELAYVIYTSGSTGKPKGVMIEHRAVINFIKGITKFIPFTPQDRILSLTTITFDIFGLEMIVPLTNGTRVIIGNREEQVNNQAMSTLIVKQKITIFQVTPSRLQLILMNKKTCRSLERIDPLLIGGEKLTQLLLDKAREYAVHKIFNLYGPTETTIWSTIRDVSRGESLNIGKPIANTSIYILDTLLRPLPIGVIGEIYIGGYGVARGYFMDQKQTKEKFIKNPFKKNEIMYKTGDLARWLTDGNIQHRGRIDGQVKIRGFRIELGEIESHICNIEGIQEAVVIDREDETGDKYLCAYLLKNSSRDYEQLISNQFEELNRKLSQQLPGYMIPACYKELEKIPLTTSGKIFRKRLPKPDFSAQQYIPPGNTTEQQITELWAKSLKANQETISIESNFFRIGGNSLKAMALVTKIKETIGIEISLLSFFKYPSIKEQAILIDMFNESKEYEHIENLETEEFII